MKSIKSTILFCILVASLGFTTCTAASVKLVFTWECDSAPVEYRIYKQMPPAQDGTPVWTQIAATAAKTHTESGVPAGTHTYRVSSVFTSLPDANGNPLELYSEPVSVTVPNVSAPSNIIITIVR